MGLTADLSNRIKSVIGRSSLYRVLLRNRVCILAYHRVLPKEQINPSEIETALPDYLFREQLSWLRSRCAIVSLGELIADPPKASKSGKPVVVITFDDGWWDTAQIAGPLMSEYGVTSTIFLTSSLVGSDQVFWWDALADHTAQASTAITVDQLKSAANASGLYSIANSLSELRSVTCTQLINHLKSFDGRSVRALVASVAEGKGSKTRGRKSVAMSWEDAQVLAMAGHTFGTHTRFHDILTTLPVEDVAEEIAKSFEDIAAHGLPTVPVLAAPNGNLNDFVLRELENTPCNYAFGMRRGTLKAPLQPFTALPRINVGWRNAPTLDRFIGLLTISGLRRSGEASEGTY